MLYTQCAFCRAIGPLLCAGTMFPHPPLATVTTPFGAACPGCGSVMTGFMCSTCMRPQYLLLPGSRPAATAPGANPAYAPVVQAQQGASGSTLKRLFEDLAGSFAREFGTALAQSVFGQQPSAQGSPWQQSPWQQW